MKKEPNKLYYYDHTLVVAKNKTEAVEKIKAKLDHVNLDGFGEWDVTEVSEVDGYNIQVTEEPSKLALAEIYYEECKEKRIHYQDIPRYLEEKIKNENEEVQDAIEIFVRYRLYDRTLRDQDFDYAKDILSKKATE